MAGSGAGWRSTAGLGARRRRRVAPSGRVFSGMSRDTGYRAPALTWRDDRQWPRSGGAAARIAGGPPRAGARRAAMPRCGHEGCAHRQRLPPPCRAALPGPHRHRRRAGPAGRVVGRDHLRGDGPRARAMAAALDAIGIGVGERVAVVSHNSARLLTALFGVSGSGRVLVPINFRLVAEEVKYIVEHSGARVLCVDPELDEALADVECEHRFVIGEHADADLEHLPPKPWVYDEDATATINYTSGTTARPKGVQLTHRNIWLNATTFGWQLGHQRPRRVPAHPAAVPLQRLGRALRRHRDGRQARHHPQDRRHRDPPPRPAARRHGDVRRAGGGQRDPRRRAELGGPDPRARARRASAAPALRRRRKTIERIEQELGWEFIQIYGLTETTPLLTMNRGRVPSSTSCRRRTRRPSSAAPAARRSASRCASPPTARCSPAATTSWPATGSSPRPRPRRSTRRATTRTAPTGSTPATAASIDDDNYVTISDRKKDVIISGGENVSSIEVEDAIFSHPEVAEVAVIGIPDEKWGELVTALVVLDARLDADARGHHRLHPHQARRLQVPEEGRVPRHAGPHRHRQAAEVQAARAVLGRPAAPGQLISPHAQRDHAAVRRPAAAGLARRRQARHLHPLGTVRGAVLGPAGERHGRDDGARQLGRRVPGHAVHRVVPQLVGDRGQPGRRPPRGGVRPVGDLRRLRRDPRPAAAGASVADWVPLFAAAGARYVVPVTKHHDGFLMWRSAVPNPHRDGWMAERDHIAELADGRAATPACASACTTPAGSTGRSCHRRSPTCLADRRACRTARSTREYATAHVARADRPLPPVLRCGTTSAGRAASIPTTCSPATTPRCPTGSSTTASTSSPSPAASCTPTSPRRSTRPSRAARASGRSAAASAGASATTARDRGDAAVARRADLDARRHRRPRRQPAAQRRPGRRRADPVRPGAAAHRLGWWLRVNGAAIYGDAAGGHVRRRRRPPVAFTVGPDGDEVPDRPGRAVGHAGACRSTRLARAPRCACSATTVRCRGRGATGSLQSRSPTTSRRAGHRVLDQPFLTPRRGAIRDAPRPCAHSLAGRASQVAAVHPPRPLDARVRRRERFAAPVATCS